MALTLHANLAFAQDSASPSLAQTVPFHSVQGRIDHLDIDLDRERLFITALGNNSVEIIDLRTGRPSAGLEHLQEPQGVVYVPLTGRLFVTNGQSGRVDIFSGNPFTVAARVDGLDDADNVRYDAARGAIYVGYGSAMAEIVAVTGGIASRIKLAGHRESFQLERQGSRIFVNVPDAQQIAIIDREKRAQTATWHLDDLRANFPMALDESDHRLFVATRRPAALLVYDTETGKRVASLSIGGDADDLFYDGQRKRLYVICGEGIVNIVQQRDADHYQIGDVLKTAPGARTGLLVPSRNALYVAVPARRAMPAEIRAYAVR